MVFMFMYINTKKKHVVLVVGKSGDSQNRTDIGGTSIRYLDHIGNISMRPLHCQLYYTLHRNAVGIEPTPWGVVRVGIEPTISCVSDKCLDRLAT